MDKFLKIPGNSAVEQRGSMSYNCKDSFLNEKNYEAPPLNISEVLAKSLIVPLLNYLH